MLEKTLNEITTKIPIEVYDIDEHPEFAARFGIRSVPTMIMTDGVVEMKRMLGTKSKADLENWLTI
jgi:thioredoxin-like negative regulator of GroEL